MMLWLRDSFRGFDMFKVTEGSDPDSRNQELPGGGESPNQLNERCVSYLNKIVQEHIGEWVVVVSHGAAILELCRHTDPANSSIRRHIPNTSLNIFVYAVSPGSGPSSGVETSTISKEMTFWRFRLGRRALGITTNKCSFSLAHAVTRFRTNNFGLNDLQKLILIMELYHSIV